MTQYNNSLETLPENYPVFDFPNINNKYIQRDDFYCLNNEKENSGNIILRNTISKEYYNSSNELIPLAERDINRFNCEAQGRDNKSKVLQMDDPIIIKSNIQVLANASLKKPKRTVQDPDSNTIELRDNSVKNRNASVRKKSLSRGFNDSKFNDLNVILDGCHQDSVIKHPATSLLSGTTKVSSACVQTHKPQWMEHLKRRQLNEDLSKNWDNKELINSELNSSIKDEEIEKASLDENKNIQIGHQNSDYFNSANINANQRTTTNVSYCNKLNRNEQQSPLKIFNHDYNTYTKDKLNNLINIGSQSSSDDEKKEYLINEFNGSRNKENETSIFRSDEFRTSNIEKSLSISENEVSISEGPTVVHDQNKVQTKTFSKTVLSQGLDRSENGYSGYSDYPYKQEFRGEGGKSALHNSQHGISRKLDSTGMANGNVGSNNTSKTSYTDSSLIYETEKEFETNDLKENQRSLYKSIIVEKKNQLDEAGFDATKSKSKILQRKVYPNGSVKFLVKDDIDEYKNSHGIKDDTATHIDESTLKLDRYVPYEYDINESFINGLQSEEHFYPSKLIKNKADNDYKNHPKIFKNQDKNFNKVDFNQYLKFGEGDIDIPEKFKGMVYDTKEKKWNSDESHQVLSNGSVEALNAIANLSVEQSFDSSNDSIRSEEYNNITFNHLPNVSNVSQMDITFSESRKALMNVLTDVIAKNKHWEVITDLNLSGKEIMNLIGLDLLVPNIRFLNVDRNSLRIFDGIPLTLDKISAKSNQFGEIMSLRKYTDLEYIDLTDNFVQNLRTFENLTHLRFLKLNSNLIRSLSGLGNMSFHNLITLDLSNNYIKGNINFKNFKCLSNLQELDLSNNFISAIDGVKYLESLISLKVDNNELIDFDFDQEEGNQKSNHKLLRKLSLKNNNLKTLDVGFFRRLRVLRVNDNINILNLDRIHKLDELLLNGCFSSKNGKDFEKNKRLQKTYDILNCVVEYNTVKILNVSNTGIHNLSVLKYLGLECLYSLFNNIDNFQCLIEDIKYLTNLKKIDFRYNPITQGFYSASSKNDLMNIYHCQTIKKQEESVEELYLECDDDLEEFRVGTGGVPENIFTSKFQHSWEIEDEKYVESLKVNNINLYRKRIYYYGLLIKLFKKIRNIDGICITNDRRKKILVEFDKMLASQ